jgi:hypothetical protein
LANEAQIFIESEKVTVIFEILLLNHGKIDFIAENEKKNVQKGVSLLTLLLGYLLF